MTNFVGGKAGLEIGTGTPQEQWCSMLQPLEAAFPGMATSFTGPATRMLWPTHQWNKGSHMAVAPGNITLADRMLQQDGEGTLQFCGEHTSLVAQGFMEGTAESGARAAAALLALTGRTEPVALRHLQRQRMAKAAGRYQRRYRVARAAHAKTSAV